MTADRPSQEEHVEATRKAQNIQKTINTAVASACPLRGTVENQTTRGLESGARGALRRGPSPQLGFHEAPIGTRTERELGASECHEWVNSYLSSSAGLPASAEQAIQLLGDHFVAFAGRGFQRLSFEDGNLAPLVGNQPGLLEGARHGGYGGAATPSIWARNSWVSGNPSAPTRSWLISNQRHMRFSTECRWLQTMDCEIWLIIAWVYRWTRPCNGPRRLSSF